MSSEMRESELQTQIFLTFGSLPFVKIWRTNTGRANMAKPGQPPRWVQFGAVGQPDITGILSGSGRFLAIEIKSATGKQTPEQRRFEAMVKSMGGVYILARSVEDVWHTLNSYRVAHG